MFHILSFEGFLFEGGKALDDVIHVKREQVDSTLKDIEENLVPVIGCPIMRIGSAGHKKESGDIDLGIICGGITETLVDKIKQAFPEREIRWMKGLQVLSISWPIEGNESNGFVQVDIIPIKNEKWATFVYKYPEGSKYTSSHRNWMLAAIASVIKENVVEDTYDGFLFDFNDGLFRVTKSFEGKRERLKHAKVIKKDLVTHDPKMLIKFLFGNYNENDVETLEDCIDIMKRADFRWADKNEEIVENFKRFLERTDLEVPKEIDGL